MTPSTLRTNCVSSVTEIGSEGDRGEGDNASCMTEGETKISKSNCCSKREDDWQIRVTESKQIQVLSQERNFYLMFIHFKHVASCLLLIITNLKFKLPLVPTSTVRFSSSILRRECRRERRSERYNGYKHGN